MGTVGVALIKYVDIQTDLREKLLKYFQHFQYKGLTREEWMKEGKHFVVTMYNHRDDVVIDEDYIVLWYDNERVRFGNLYSFVVVCGIWIPYYEWVFTDRFEFLGELFLYNKKLKTGKRTTEAELKRTTAKQQALLQEAKSRIRKMRSTYAEELKEESKPQVHHSIPKGYIRHKSKGHNFNVKFNNRGRR